MRSEQEVAQVLSLVQEGLNDCAISRVTGIPRGTVKDWRHGKIPRRAQRDRATRDCSVCRGDKPSPPSRQYSYLLGQYLGDGSIAQFRRGVFALRIFSFSGYPKIIGECVAAMRAVMPANRVGVHRVSGVRLVIITSYSKHWPCLFPQHGPGRKHERGSNCRIGSWRSLSNILKPCSAELIHSDGCRDANKVKGKSYPRYFFSNMSLDIQRIFTDSCDQLGIPWTRPYFKTISIAKRPAVALMDTFIGPKR